MKEILRFAVLLVVLLVARQTYWVVSRGGNLNLYAYNSSDVEIVTLEVFVNGESVNIQDHSNKKTLDHKGLSLYKTSGTHEVKVVSTKHNISKTAKINLRTAKWINIEFANSENDPNNYDLQLTVESSPIVAEQYFHRFVLYLAESIILIGKKLI